MSLTGFKLTLPDSTVFRVSSEVSVSHGTQALFLVDGRQQFVTAIEQFFNNGGQPNKGDSLMQGIFAGVGAGIHTITVTFTQFEGSADNWGSAASGDGPVKKMQTLNREITTQNIGSQSPADLEVGEYSSSGTYDPIPVVISESDLTFEPAEQSSGFTGTLTFIEATDVTDAIDITETPGHA